MLSSESPANLIGTPGVSEGVELSYVAALKKADVDGMVAGLEKEIDQLQDRLDQFNHERKIEVDGRILELAS